MFIELYLQQVIKRNGKWGRERRQGCKCSLLYLLLKNNDYNNLVKFQIHYAFNWHNRQR